MREIKGKAAKINRDALMFLGNTLSSYIWSSEWNGTDEALEKKTLELADLARKYDSNPQHDMLLYARRYAKKLSEERRQQEWEFELLCENHEMGNCDCGYHDFMDYGINTLEV